MSNPRYFANAHGNRFEGHHPLDVKGKIREFELTMRLPSVEINVHDRFTLIISRLRDAADRLENNTVGNFPDTVAAMREAVEALEQV